MANKTKELIDNMITEKVVNNLGFLNESVDEREIKEVLSSNKSRILDDNYPATKAYRILCDEYSYNYEDAKKAFIDFMDDMGLIYNIDNF